MGVMEESCTARFRLGSEAHINGQIYIILTIARLTKSPPLKCASCNNVAEGESSNYRM